jgi:hypothetical protein
LTGSPTVTWPRSAPDGGSPPKTIPTAWKTSRPSHSALLLGVPAACRLRLVRQRSRFDTPTAKACGILSSPTTARRAWSYTVSLSVPWLAPPRSRVPRGTYLTSQSHDCLSSGLGGELGSRNPNASCSFDVLPGQGPDRIHREVSGRNRQRRVFKERSLAGRHHCTWTRAFIPPLKGVGFRLIFCKISSQPFVGC